MINPVVILTNEFIYYILQIIIGMAGWHNG